MTEVLEAITATRLLPVVVIDDARAAPPLAAALQRGGVHCAEITLRTAAAEAALRAMAQDPSMVVGAGTVLNAAQAARVAAPLSGTGSASRPHPNCWPRSTQESRR